MRMTILQRYVWRALWTTLALTLAVFTFVLCLGNVVRDILALVVSETVGLGAIFELIALAIPYALSFALPLAMLASTLLVLGRLSADMELTAARACGVSLFRLVLPVIAASVLLSFISMWVNSVLAPNCRYLMQKNVMEVGLRQPAVLLEEGRLITEIPGYRMFIEKSDPKRNEIKGVYLWILNDQGKPTQAIRAQRGILTANVEKQKMYVQLFDVRMDSRDPEHPYDPAKIRTGVYAKRYPLDLDLRSMLSGKEVVRDLKKTTSWDLILEAEELKAGGVHPTPLLVEVQKRLSMGAACFAFTILG
ncbi:MAG: LptF/LptG family permease, partial [Verrucomicrobiae bacterium]|nr:LptF/LptG family permease [Verrucomicrobiae bacterium]